MTDTTDKHAKHAGPKAAAPMSVYLLADHLDAALAAGEDLLRQSISWHSASFSAPEAAELQRDELRATLKKIRSLELTLISRAMRAREHAEAVARRDQRFKLIGSLFASGTVALLDAVAALGDTTRHNFETGDLMTVYLRSRGLLTAEAAAPDEGAVISVTETFLAAGRMSLGELLDMFALFLDALETHYDLFVVETADDARLLAAEQSLRQSDADGEDLLAAAVSRSVKN